MVESHSGGCLADGRPYENLYAWAVEVRDGKIHTLREYFDSHYVMGLMARGRPSERGGVQRRSAWLICGA